MPYIIKNIYLNFLHTNYIKHKKKKIYLFRYTDYIK